MGVPLSTDNFNRADNADLGPTWDVRPSETAFKVISNHATASDHALDCGETFNGINWPTDQYAQAEITTGSAGGPTLGQGPGVSLRSSTVVRTYYRCVIANTASGDKIELAKFIAGSNTQLATRAVTYSAGAVLKLSVTGSVLTITYNGSVAGSTVSDSAIGSGRAGLAFSSGVVFTDGVEFVDNWEGGNIEQPSFRVRSLPPRVFAPRLAR